MAYWLAGGVLRPLGQQQLAALLPQAGGVTLAAGPKSSGDSGQGANAPPPSAAAAASNVPVDDMDNMTRACLIPVFVVISQVEGMEGVLNGALDGFKAGKMVSVCKNLTDNHG